MGDFFGVGTASAAEAVPNMGTLAGGGSPAPIITPPDSLSLPVQMASYSPATIAGGDRPAPTSPAASVPKTIAGAPVAAPSVDQNAKVFDARFKGTPLEGKWDAVKAAADRHGIPAPLAASVMALETGNGKTVNGNNVGGVMDPKTGMQGKQQFTSIDKGIDAATRVMAKNYTAAGGDLKKMSQLYAPIGAKNDKYGTNKGWLPGVTSIMGTFGQ